MRSARVACRRRRIERAYQEAQLMVERTALWAASAMPPHTWPGQDPYPPPPDDAHALEAAALRLYWSPEVRELVKVWAAARNRFAVHVLAARDSESFRGEAWLAAPEMKQSLQNAGDALVAQMSGELLTAGPARRWRWRPRLQDGSRLGLDSSGTPSE
jgi:hypothetical protein